jgi:hypothetical protein
MTGQLVLVGLGIVALGAAFILGFLTGAFLGVVVQDRRGDL